MTEVNSVAGNVSYRDRLVALISEFEGKLIERERIIRIMLLAMFSKQHVFLIGDPGVGKTYLTEIISSAISDAKYFDFLVAHDTTQEELLGCLVRDNASGKVRREIEGTILDSHFVFLDEMFKGQSILLNSFLGIMNERVYKMGNAGTIKVPLVSLFGASNEFPSGNALLPYDDRLIFRYEIKRIVEVHNYIRYINGDFDMSKKLSNTFTLNDIEYASVMSQNIKFNDLQQGMLIAIKSKLRGDKLEISDRKMGPKFAISVFKMSAFLNGRDSIDFSDLLLLLHMAWRDYDDKARAESAIIDTIFTPSKQIEIVVKSCIDDKYTTIIGQIKSKYIGYLKCSTELNSKTAEEEFIVVRNAICKLMGDIGLVCMFHSGVVSDYEFQTLVQRQAENNIFLKEESMITYSQAMLARIDELGEAIALLKDEIESWLNNNKSFYEYANNCMMARARENAKYVKI